MVFIPLTWDEAVDLRAGIAADHYRGCAATQSLLASMGGHTHSEEAEYAALSNAGVLALLRKPGSSRLVVAAEVQPRQLTDFCEPYGEVELRGLTWTQVRALFADEPGAMEAARLASEAVTGQSMTGALAAPEAALLLDEYDLLWFAPEELYQLQL